MGTPFLIDIKRYKNTICNRSARNLINALNAGRSYFRGETDGFYDFQDCNGQINNLIRQVYFNHSNSYSSYFTPEMRFKFDSNAQNNSSKIVY